jgi:hypothetical protein
MEQAAAPARTPALSAWQRFAFVRRRRGETKTDQSASAAAAHSTDSGRPTVTQLMTWMLNLRRGGVGFIYWNAAKLPLETALMRAARLDEAAVIDVVGHRVLVVEPLHSRSSTTGRGERQITETTVP